ncbi:MAG: gliding motility-associated C-terminal domain-containing protein [Cyclobacteriaceae bacterium]|nr:gliding motility-associated C-terminal domain-containing protein [Cyclobacteriaceae bacterium]
MGAWLRTWFIVLFIGHRVASAQHVSQLGRFQVDNRKGCVSLTVTITNANLITTGYCTGLNPCEMNWGDGTPVQTNVFTHTYTQAGTYTLTVLYQTIGPDQITITVRPNQPPVFELYSCNGNQVQVRVTDTFYDAYIINYNDASPEVQVPKGTLAVNNHTYSTSGAKTISVRGKDVSAADNCISANQAFTAVPVLPVPAITELRVMNSSSIEQDFATATNVAYRLEIATNNNTTFQLVQNVYNQSNAALSGLRTDDNYYCFRLGAFDRCAGNVTSYSNIICSADLDLTLLSLENRLTWSTQPSGISNFTIQRNNAPLATVSSSPYSDTNVSCRTTYCYRVRSNYANGSRSLSAEKCGETFSSAIPAAIQNTTAVVGTGSVELTWIQDPAFTPESYTLFKRPVSGLLSPIGNTTVNQFTDNNYTTAEPSCYRINYRDVCGNNSNPGLDVCPIVLTGSLNSDNSISLSWSAYEGWLNGVNHYEVDKFNTSGTLIQTFNTGTNTVLLDDTSDPANQAYRYVVRALANDGGLGMAVSNELVIIKEPKLYYPTAFTPDGQGPAENEMFKVFGQYLSSFEMRIFNRWGELLFVTRDIDSGWDGRYQGREQPEGTYVFVARITDMMGRNFTRSGSVVLLRKK